MSNRSLPSLTSVKKQIGGSNWDGFVAAVTAVKPKRYVALLTQTSTNDPVVTVILNELSGPVVWTRASAGVYNGTLASAFTADKTALKVGAQVTSLQRAVLVRSSANAVQLGTFVLSEVSNVLTSTATDALLTGFLVEIEIYP